MKNYTLKLVLFFIFTLSFWGVNAEIILDKTEINNTKNPATLTIKNVSGTPGSSISVPVNTSAITDLSAFQWTIEYDATKLTFVNCTNWSTINTGDLLISTPSVGKITFVYAKGDGTGDNIPEGKFFDLNFDILAGAVGISHLVWSDNPTNRLLINSTSTTIPTTWNSGSISIITPQNPSLTIDNVYAAPNSTVTVPVNAIDLYDLTGFQWTIDYDDTKLSNPVFSNWAAGVDVASVNINTSTSGKISIVYNSYPNSISDIVNKKFFDITFNTAVGASGTASATWSGTPTAKELSNSIPEQIIATWNGGSVIFSPTITIEDVIGTAGSSVAVPVNALNLTDIAGFQWTVIYDDTKLSNPTFSNWATGVNTANLTINTSTSGEIKLVYNDYANPFAINDALFFNLNFDVLVGATGVAPVTWSDVPTVREVSNTVPEIIIVTWIDGSVILDISWNGSVSSDWQNPLNWTPNTVPTALHNAIIPDVSPNSFPIIDDGAIVAVCNNLTINANASVTIATNGQMTVSSVLTNNAGISGLIIKSDVHGNGSLIINSAVEATVERYITGDNWHYMFPTLSTIATATYTSEGTYTNNNLYSYLEPNKDYWKPTQIYETSGWTSEVASTNLRTDKGYIYNRYGMATRTVSQTGGDLFVGDKDFTITYITNTGAIDASCTQGWNNYDGWNLVGNPYASAIDWGNVDKTNIENVVYCYDDTQDKYAYYGTDGYSGIGITVNNGSQYIPAGQGFMIKQSTAGSSTFTLNATTSDDRVHNSQTFWKGETNIVPNLIRLNIEKDAYNDETVIRTLPEDYAVTEGHDGDYDAYKLFAWDNTKPQIYTLTNANDHNFAINSLPEFTENKEIKLGAYIGETGEYTINMTENNFENTHIWLEDRSLELITNLLNNPNYTFNQTAENNIDRFYLHFGINHAPVLYNNIPDQIAPVNEVYEYYLPANMFADEDFEDFVTISVTLANGNNLPNWLVYNSEENRFEGTPDIVQTLNIKVTGSDIFGANVSDEFILEVKGTNSISESNVNSVSLYPNPTTGIFTIQISNKVNNAKILVSSITGQVHKQLSTNSKQSIIDLSKFAKGIYFVDIEINGQTVRKKLILK